MKFLIVSLILLFTISAAGSELDDLIKGLGNDSFLIRNVSATKIGMIIDKDVIVRLKKEIVENKDREVKEACKAILNNFHSRVFSHDLEKGVVSIYYLPEEIIKKEKVNVDDYIKRAKIVFKDKYGELGGNKVYIYIVDEITEKYATQLYLDDKLDSGCSIDEVSKILDIMVLQTYIADIEGEESLAEFEDILNLIKDNIQKLLLGVK